MESQLRLLAMSEEQLAALIDAAQRDVGLQEKLKGAADLDAVLAIAKEAGFDVSKAALQPLALIDAAQRDAGLQEKLKGAADLDAVVAIAKEAGFDVSKAALLRYQANVCLELSDEDLERVAGGLSLFGKELTLGFWVFGVGGAVFSIGGYIAVSIK